MDIDDEGMGGTDVVVEAVKLEKEGINEAIDEAEDAMGTDDTDIGAEDD